MNYDNTSCSKELDEAADVKISVVATMYYSAQYLRAFYDRMVKAVKQITDNYEIIFVNDGSPDDSLEIALQIRASDQRVSIVDLSRNFGHHRAILAGLSFTKGDLVFLIDCDLEEAPENLYSFYKEMLQDSDCDVVYGIQKKRRGTLSARLFASCFYKALNFMSGAEFDPLAVVSRLMSRRYVQSLLTFREREIFLLGICAITGYKQKPLKIDTLYKGKTVYTFAKKFNLAITAITSLSSYPLILIFYIGVIMSICAMLGVLSVAADKVIYGTTLLGWTSLIVSVWLVGGLIIIMMGIIGLYIAGIFNEVKRRPLVIIKKVHAVSDEDS